MTVLDAYFQRDSIHDRPESINWEARSCTGDDSRLAHNRHNRPIGAHFHSVDFEFACFGKDLGETVCDVVEAGPVIGVRKGLAVDQDAIL